MLNGRKARHLASFLALAMAVVGFAAAPAQASAQNGCYKAGDAEFSYFRSEIARYAREGKLSKAAARAVTCDPRTAHEYVTTEVTFVPSDGVSTLSTGCRESGGLVYTFSLGGELGRHRQTLNWCWDWTYELHRVRDWTGECSGHTTGWGTANGWQWDGCVQNDFIAYKLNGYSQGGVHHKTQGKFSSIVPWTPSKYFTLNIWGHYDGTCDIGFNGEIRHYC